MTAAKKFNLAEELLKEKQDVTNQRILVVEDEHGIAKPYCDILGAQEKVIE